MLMKKVFTLVFIRQENSILLGLKKRGFGVHKWNGFGGKVEANETVLEAAVRELQEECCLTVKANDLKNVAHLEFTFEGETLAMDVRVFVSTIFEGTPTETEEMMPKWFDCDQIPYKDMWPDDRYWFPKMLQGKLFHAKFHYKGFDKILWHEIEELKCMDTYYANNNIKY